MISGLNDFFTTELFLDLISLKDFSRNLDRTFGLGPFELIIFFRINKVCKVLLIIIECYNMTVGQTRPPAVAVRGD